MSLIDRLKHTAFLNAQPWQISYLFSLASRSWLIHIGVVSLVTYILANTLPGTLWPYVWGGVMIILSLLLFTLARTQNRSIALENPAGNDAAILRSGWLHTGLVTAIGIVWGIGAFGLDAQNLATLTIYSLALGGTALGAVSSQHMVPRSCFASVWTSLVLLALAHLLIEGPHISFPVAIMILLYALTLSILTQRMYGFFASRHELAQTLSDKVQQLTAVTDELEIARRQAEEANMSKTRFLAQASHDLRQPIHAISLLVSSLKDTRMGSEQRQIVSSVEKSVESVINLFGSLLDISRLELGGIVAKNEPVELNGFIAGFVEQNAEFAQRYGCTIRIVPNRNWVITDPNLLLTILQNILSNALKFSQGGTIIIGVRRRGNRLAVQISDTGKGIGADEISRVFSEFYRVSGTTNRVPEGMGLGLAIVKRLTDILDLNVEMKSRPGEGTSVLISGLEKTTPQDRVEPAQKLSQAHPLVGQTICIVDDDLQVLEATQSLLERWGCSVKPALDPDQIGGHVDAIICDFDFGNDFDGFDAIQKIRQRVGREVPAIILTGHIDPAAFSRSLEVNIPVLHKPVSAVKLRAVLTRLCLQDERAAAQ